MRASLVTRSPSMRRRETWAYDDQILYLGFWVVSFNAWVVIHFVGGRVSGKSLTGIKRYAWSMLVCV